jgi:serine/threonine-protein kinase ATR
MEKIAPDLISRWATQRSILLEFSRLIALPALDVISLNLPAALPPLFASRDLRTIEKISEDLHTRPSSLFLKHSGSILAHIFMLPGSEQTNKALDFVLSILVTSSLDESGDIDIRSVVKSCAIALLASLVINLGFENEDKVKAVMNRFYQ